jgi:hypothetical protein
MNTQESQGDLKSTLMWTIGAIVIVVAIAAYMSM